MTDNSKGSDQPNGEKNSSKLEALLAGYLDQLDSGKRLDPKKILEDHPDCGLEIIDSLQQFIDLGDDSEDTLELETLGDYKLVNKIGQGGMGVVYEAEQISFNRNVALKVLNRTSSTIRFKREIEAIGRLNHPGIVVLYEAGQHKGLHFFAQELVKKGFSLADDLRDKKEKADYPSGYFRDVAKLTAQVADALQHAHEANVIHRDLKPSNILLTPDGKPKVTDFGLAKVMDASSITMSGGSAGGTPYYMSPEQAESRKRKIDKRTDIFSLGVTLYEMLTLKQPFTGETSLAVMNQIISFDPQEPQKANPRAPRDLSVICQKAMEKSPEKRYQTMKEFSEDLKRFLSGDVILAKPAGLGIRFWKLVKRNPMVSAVLTTILVFAVIVPWVMFRNQQALTQQEKENAAKLKKEKENAIKAMNLAESRYDEITRLSDVKLLLDLRKEAEALWPAYPDKIKRFEQWIGQAEELLSRVEDHRQSLAALQENVIPLSKEEKQEEKESHPQWKFLLELKETEQFLKDEIASLEKAKRLSEKEKEDADDKEDLTWKIGPLKDELKALSKQIEELEKEVSIRRARRFENDVIEWRFAMLLELVGGLDDIKEKKEGLLDNIKDRLQFASTIQKESVFKHQRAWDEAIASIANIKECPKYKGFKLKEQLGFTPIGRDPETGLWEFAHLQTGETPIRDKDGKLILKEETGLVFVLIPGGSFVMGAIEPSEEHPLHSPNVDPFAHIREAPAHEVTLKPFFMSKYEMTQGQWLRFTEDNPSTYKPGAKFGDKTCSLLHPVEQVSWKDCALILSRLNLRLPTESEWEYAARAGTTTVFWTGDEKESLRDKKAVNIGDLYYKRNGGFPSRIAEEWLDDGYTVHAPIGTFTPNAFGLHEMMGNVEEWCQDVYHYNYISTPTDGSACVRDSIGRVYRGGNWGDVSKYCRVAFRFYRDPSYRDFTLGVRPAYSCVP